MKRLVYSVLCIMMLFSGSLYAQNVNVKGKVIDAADGTPLPGVTVQVIGTSNGVATDVDGTYSLQAKIGDVLKFSYIGYITQEVKFRGGALNIKLASDAQQMDAAVVVGFGTQRKSNITGAVATVDTKSLESRPVTSAVQALQGAVAGMNFSVGNGGGELGNGLSINIRGAGSIGNTSSSPLVLIDGIEGDMSTLNPQDIANISVLKDASSSSIYGSRAAFGVILITTKTGKEGKTVVNYNNNVRFASPLLQPKMLDSEAFANYFNTAAANAGQNPVFSSEILKKIKQYKNGEISYATTWDPVRKEWKNYTNSFANVDWYKEFYKNWVPSQEHNLSLRGGSDKINYYISGNYLGQNGLMRYNTDKRDRYTLNAKISAKLSKFVTLDYSGKFSRVDYGRSSYSSGLFYHNIARRWPTLPVYDPNGHYVHGNEISHLKNGRNENQNDELIQQLKLTINPLENWNIYADFGYKTGTGYNHNYVLPIYGYDDKEQPFATALQFGSFWSPGMSRISESTSKWNFFTTNIFSDYVFSINEEHNFKVMAGFQSELSKSRGFNAYRDDVYTTEVLAIDATYGENDGVGGSFNHWATAGFFGRLNYDYAGKYLVEFSGRYDGTSRFLRDKRWNFFPSFSLGWNIAKEDFWQEIGGFADRVSNLKLRVSWGELGNQNIKKGWSQDYYPFYPEMPLGAANGYWILGGNKTNTAGTPGLVSSLISWERVASWNYGLDVSMFEGRLNLVFDYFQRETKDMVGPAPELPNILGTAVPKINNTDMKSRGFEIEASWRDMIGEVNYGIKLTLTDSRQFVTKYPNENKILTSYYEGEELNNIWGYKVKGIAKTNAEMAEWLKNNNQDRLGSNWDAGDLMYMDLNGDKEINKGQNTLDDHGDLAIIGNSTPRYNFGIDLDASYKGFDLRVFIQGTGKRDVAVGGPYFTGANGNMWQSAGFTDHLDYFRPADTKDPLGANENSYYPRPLMDKGGKNFHTSDRWLQNGAYARLKNLQIGYTLPEELTEKVGISKLRIYFSGENLLTITKMTDIFDPETYGGGWGNGKIYPLSRILSCGLSLTF